MKLNTVNWKFFLLPKQSPLALRVQIHWPYKPVYSERRLWRVYTVLQAAFGQQGVIAATS